MSRRPCSTGGRSRPPGSRGQCEAAKAAGGGRSFNSRSNSSSSPTDLQLGQGWSPTLTAVAIVSWPIGITLMSGVAQRYATTHGRRVIGIGLAVMLAGAVALIAVLSTIGPQVTWWQVSLPVLVTGLGMGMCVPILASVVLADVPGDSAGAGSGVANAVMQLGTAFGVAVVGVIFFWLATTGAPTDPATPAHREAFSEAAAATLWYNAGAFLVALLLVPMLPRAAQPEPEAEPRSEDRVGPEATHRWATPGRRGGSFE
ncbi:MFS transporter [Nocardiopsis rhodophaea]|uniref:MFS transporter n=1 Tax=Nocardiopsis rhodophaea TaxID=280238 RepID=UPI0031D73E76